MNPRLRLNSEERRIELVDGEPIELDGSSIPLVIIKQAKLLCKTCDGYGVVGPTAQADEDCPTCDGVCRR